MAGGVSVRQVSIPADLALFRAAARAGQAGNQRWVEPVAPYYDALLGPRSPARHDNTVVLFVAEREGRPVGRIAAIRNAAHLAKFGDATGQFGLFECIDDAAVATALFDAALAVLRRQGLRRVAGPFSLTINHEAGLLVAGFDQPHVAHTGHAPPFYAGLIEAQGFTKAMDLQSWVVRVGETDFPARVDRMAARLPDAASIRTEGVTVRSWSARTTLLNDLYNEIWAANWNAIPVSDAEARSIARLTLPTLRLDWLRIAWHRDEPIAVMTQIPDSNEGLQGLGGSLLPFGWSRLLWRIHGRGTTMTRMPMFGLKRAWHRTRLGTLAANRLMADAIRQAQNAGAREMEISWILETNTVFLNMVAALPARLTRTHRIYERAL